jgi:HD-GYP domain-containing protein (c-di-GMP phosphodiesterase class II)
MAFSRAVDMRTMSEVRRQAHRAVSGVPSLFDSDTDAEMSLVRRHPEVGYSILSGVPFGGPVAQAVLQHHERLDGSGYPDGLSGGAILLEARILGVADVVEAMLAHRPYRPALGLQAALDEIRAGVGKLYDPAVVLACLDAFTGTDLASQLNLESPLEPNGSPNRDQLPLG